MIAVIDYGCGNLYSLMGSLKEIGAEATLATTPEDIYKADRIILPGVGAFGDASAKLVSSGLDEVIKQQVAKAIIVLKKNIKLTEEVKNNIIDYAKKSLFIVFAHVVRRSMLTQRGVDIHHHNQRHARHNRRLSQARNHSQGV